MSTTQTVVRTSKLNVVFQRGKKKHIRSNAKNKLEWMHMHCTVLHPNISESDLTLWRF